MRKLPRRRKSHKPAKSRQFTVSAEDAAKYSLREEEKLFSFSIPAQPRAGRPRTAKTEMLLTRVRRLREQKKPLVPLATEFWPNLSEKEASHRLRTFLSKHRRDL